MQKSSFWHLYIFGMNLRFFVFVFLSSYFPKLKFSMMEKSTVGYLENCLLGRLDSCWLIPSLYSHWGSLKADMYSQITKQFK